MEASSYKKQENISFQVTKYTNPNYGVVAGDPTGDDSQSCTPVVPRVRPGLFTILGNKVSHILKK
ncbi:MAG: hypothetical protein PHT07_14970 [Paludibacter sp.]|nr:hypothetical protein [Paludibacter sp.]